MSASRSTTDVAFSRFVVVERGTLISREMVRAGFCSFRRHILTLAVAANYLIEGQMKEFQDLGRYVQAHLRCDARFDLFTRVLYSTDASNHRIRPLGVLFPRHGEDLLAIAELATEIQVPIIARGAGTGLAGQAIGTALILDCSRYLNKIHQIDFEARMAEVDPGVICNQLNGAVRGQSLMFAPDPSTADRATFGGMVGNNAAGSHSIQYGMCADHVVSIDGVLSDGTEVSFSEQSTSEFGRKARATTPEGRIHRAIASIREESERLRTRWPHTWRNASGYNLDYLLGSVGGRPPVWYDADVPYPPCSVNNLARLLCGSEGTLALFRRIRVRLVRRPKVTVLVLLPYDSNAAACDAAPQLLKTKPAAIELMPSALFRKAQEVVGFARRLTFMAEVPNALLALEYTGDSLEEAKAACASISQRGMVVDRLDAQADFWAVRTAGLGLLMKSTGDTRPIPFIEDVSVPIERLGEYVRRVDRLLSEHGTYGEWYGHASAGCLHFRPVINLKSKTDVARMRSIAQAVAEVVASMSGVLTGEHGDGLTRTEFLSSVFGSEIARAFREVKEAFDPQGLLNPGKIVPPESLSSDKAGLDLNLRYEPTCVSVPTIFAYRNEGDLQHAIENCNGCGACLKEKGLMCPSFQVERYEANSPRARANLLREVLAGQVPNIEWGEQAIYETLGQCLQCKGCKSECPSGVDMARIKSEYLALVQENDRVPLRSQLFGNIAQISRWAQPWSLVLNVISPHRSMRALLEKTVGISRGRSLLTFARKRFSQWWKTHPVKSEGEPVVLFLDTFTEFNSPEIGVAAVSVLEAAGYRVIVVPGQVCCGRSMISKGILKEARDLAAKNLKVLAPYAEQGIGIVGLEPSCILTLRDEYLEFFPHDPRASLVSQHACLIEELLTQPRGNGISIDRLSFAPCRAPLLFHGHCFTKSLVGNLPTLRMLRATGTVVEEIDSGCCGMAGSFGYEREHYDVSMRMGERWLFPVVRAGIARGAEIAASGVSCRTQILDGTGIRARHPIQIVAERLSELRPSD